MNRIIRAVKDRENPYVMLRKTLVEDPNLSCAAVGLMAYILSKPDGWEVRSYELMHSRNLGRYALRTIFAELKKARYIIRRKEQDQYGRFQWVTLIYESALTEKEHARLIGGEDDVLELTFSRETPGVNNQPMDAKCTENHTQIHPQWIDPSTDLPPTEDLHHELIHEVPSINSLTTKRESEAESHTHSPVTKTVEPRIWQKTEAQLAMLQAKPENRFKDVPQSYQMYLLHCATERIIPSDPHWSRWLKQEFSRLPEETKTQAAFMGNRKPEATVKPTRCALCENSEGWRYLANGDVKRCEHAGAVAAPAQSVATAAAAP